jgi:hypothetical protein
MLAMPAALAVRISALDLHPPRFALRVPPIELAAWGWIIATTVSVVAAVEVQKLLLCRQHLGLPGVLTTDYGLVHKHR